MFNTSKATEETKRIAARVVLELIEDIKWSGATYREIPWIDFGVNTGAAVKVAVKAGLIEAQKVTAYTNTGNRKYRIARDLTAHDLIELRGMAV